MMSRMTAVLSLSPARRYSLSLSLSDPCGASCRTSESGSRHRPSSGTMWSCCRDSMMPISLRAFRYDSHVFLSGSLFHFWYSSYIYTHTHMTLQWQQTTRCHVNTSRLCSTANSHIDETTATKSSVLCSNTTTYFFKILIFVLCLKILTSQNKVFNPLSCKGNYNATSNKTLAVDGWAVTSSTARRGLGRAPACPVPNVTAHPSTASVPITVLLYNGLLLCGFNVPIKGYILNDKNNTHKSLSILLHFYFLFVTVVSADSYDTKIRVFDQCKQ